MYNQFLHYLECTLVAFGMLKQLLFIPHRYIKVTPTFIMEVYKENPNNDNEPFFYGYYFVEQEFPFTKYGPREMTVSYVGRSLPSYFAKAGNIFLDNGFGIKFYGRIASPPPAGKTKIIVCF